MNNDELRQYAEQYIEQQLNTLAEFGSRTSITSEVREDMVISAMKAAGYVSPTNYAADESLST